MRLFALLTTAIILQTGKGPLTGSSAGPVVTVAVRPQSEISGASITLGDIADVTGADKALATRVAGIDVGTAPLIGLSRTLLKSDIVTRLRYNRIDTTQVDVVSAPSVKVTRVGADVAIPEVVEFATNALKAARKDPSDSVQIEALPTPYKWVIPPGKRDMQAGPIRGADGGVATVPVTLMVDGKPAKTVEISFKIKRMGSVLVAARQLEAHTVLKAEDVSLAVQEVVPGSVALTDAALVIGMRTTRQIAAGAVLTKAAVETSPVIMIGAPVDVNVVVGGITVATSGVARSQGAAGDRIRVFISKTNKEVSAIVVDAKTVRVEENG